MTRKKVKLSFIANDSSRKATFKKRKKGLIKKVSELSTLCGIDACAIIYSPYEAQPEVWPDARGAHHVVSQFKGMPEMEQSKKMVNQESFIRGRVSKVAEQLKKVHRDNLEKEMTELMYRCLTGKLGLQGLGVGELNDVGWVLDENLKEIGKRIEGLKKGGGVVEEEEKGVAVVEMGGGGGQWWTEWMGNIPVDSQQMGGGGMNIMGFNDGNNKHPANMWF